MHNLDGKAKRQFMIREIIKYILLLLRRAREEILNRAETGVNCFTIEWISVQPDAR